MSQHDLNIANQGFPAFRADLNDALVALGSTNSGATAPATTYANQLWYDTANNILKIRNEDNDAWISITTLDQANDVLSAISLNTINEGTSASGVTVDGLLIKDGVIPSSGLPIGSVLQVVSANYSTGVSNSTSTFADTGLTATITPKFATSKVLVLISQNGITKSGSTSCAVKFFRNATELGYLGWNMGYTATGDINYVSGASVSYLDSPATTSATTYKTQFNSRQNVAGTQVQDAGATSTITLLEIAA